MTRILAAWFLSWDCLAEHFWPPFWPILKTTVTLPTSKALTSCPSSEEGCVLQRQQCLNVPNSDFQANTGAETSKIPFAGECWPHPKTQPQQLEPTMEKTALMSLRLSPCAGRGSGAGVVMGW